MRYVPLLALALALGLAGCQGTDQSTDENASSDQMQTQESEWIRPFNGQNFDGWSKHGGAATYRVENGTVVGTSVRNSENTFMCTNATYGDFELRFETRVHDSLNSGVQIRSKIRQEDDRVYGPQVEIEASLQEGAEAGYVYGEATGRGWLHPDEELQPTTVFQDGEWNGYRVVAEGPRIRTWVNGQPIADLTHEEIYQNHREGRICLQVHGLGDEGPYEVSWRNIRVREL